MGVPPLRLPHIEDHPGDAILLPGMLATPGEAHEREQALADLSQAQAHPGKQPPCPITS